MLTEEELDQRITDMIDRDTKQAAFLDAIEAIENGKGGDHH